MVNLPARMTYLARFYHPRLGSGSRPTSGVFDLGVRSEGQGGGFAAGRVLLRDVTVRYGRRIALDAVSGEFAAGSLTAVVGANGTGKSTLLAAIAGVVRLASGVVHRAARQRLAHLPQLAAMDLGYPLTVSELITLGGWREFGAFRSPGTALRARVAEVAETVGLAGRLARRLGEISVGELQRALFARLILQDAAVILLDEPFASVDAQTLSVLLDQVIEWHREGRTVIAVLHDLDLVRAQFPSTLVLARHSVAWGATELALPAVAA
jgi:zinc/manganese transport system ATP-binding protein